jgi:hypothetical protein
MIYNNPVAVVRNKFRGLRKLSLPVLQGNDRGGYLRPFFIVSTVIVPHTKISSCIAGVGEKTAPVTRWTKYRKGTVYRQTPRGDTQTYPVRGGEVLAAMLDARLIGNHLINLISSQAAVCSTDRPHRVRVCRKGFLMPSPTPTQGRQGQG